ncbi:MAG: TMEM175 family protein [bacterium]
MSKSRLEAFSDGVLAIIITIMVLEMKVPHSADPSALQALIPVFLSYILSFVHIGIYWNNHHHMLQATQQVNGRILWANLHLLFWLSLLPFATAWMGENQFAAWPVTLYGVILLLAGTAYYLLARVLVAFHGKDSALGQAFGRDLKGKASLLLYLVAVLVARWRPLLSCALYVTVALIWLIPDRRIERRLSSFS